MNRHDVDEVVSQLYPPEMSSLLNPQFGIVYSEQQMFVNLSFNGMLFKNVEFVSTEQDA
jgi:hypothetical protein